jgi:hypothetical protein
VVKLAEINDRLKANGNLLTFSVSIACTDSKDKWEPHVPSVAARAETLRKAAAVGIDTMVAIRPLIPDVAESELDAIVDMTKDYAVVYYSGPLYLKELGEDTLSAEEVNALGAIGTCMDHVEGLGEFLELETVITDISLEEGEQEFYRVVSGLGIDIADSIAASYSDLVPALD